MTKIVRKILTILIISASVFLLVGFSNTESGLTANPFVRVKNEKPTQTFKDVRSGFQPGQIKEAYGMDKMTVTGKGQTIAIIVAYGSPTIQNDIDVFNKQFNLPSTNIQIVYPTGPPDKINEVWALETSLDVQWVHALAPDAKILLVVAKSDSLSSLISAIDYTNSLGPQVVSMSWGNPEFSSEIEYESYFNRKGSVYIASSGDSGGSNTNWPATSPHVLSVGGTSLTLNPNKTYNNELAWSRSGGGTSLYMVRPNYQDHLIDIVGEHRGIPDVSWDADPFSGATVYLSTPFFGETGWFIAGGTSFGAPCWAAIIALVNETRSVPLTNIDLVTALYKIQSSSINTFHDITEGTNGKFSSQIGYDLAAGLGSPQVNNLIASLTSNF